MSGKNLFNLSPEITHAVLGGQAFIDEEGLNVISRDQARKFALNYGFDMGLPRQRSQIVKTFEDALTFLETVVLEGTDLKVPPVLSELQDPLDLLTMASAKPRDDIASWSCAVLRVMHTLLYIDNNIFLRFLPEIQQQIFDRYDRHLVLGNSNGWFLRGDYEVPLIDIVRKENKDRDSMLLKLLHKPENVAETIYDHIGIRFVVEDLLDVLLVLRFLTDHNVFQAAHIKPSRTRNLIIDVMLLEEWMAVLPDTFSAQELSPNERQAICEKLAQRVGWPSVNPYSSSDYSALQFTVNTLMRLPEPSILALESISKEFNGNGKYGVADQFHIHELIQAQEEFAFFFPHEVQIMEKSGFNNSRMGPASHLEYKRRQREVVRKRVLRGILPRER
ncbi:MAG: TIGR04552 family protein [Holophagales bacterium]|jgi:uncharacterized protein (TIGR04562 family)|nr:TIGR04552 family protein [Holophagales bacterium]